MRTRREDFGAMFDQKGARSVDASEAALCARLDQYEKSFRAAPCAAKELLKSCRCKFTQRIRDDDCVAGLEFGWIAQVSLQPTCITNDCVRAPICKPLSQAKPLRVS